MADNDDFSESDVSDSDDSSVFDGDLLETGNETVKPVNATRILPYRFEPLPPKRPRGARESLSLGQPAESSSNDRLNNTNWCTCGCCIPMPTAVESVCCREEPKVLVKLVASGPGSCIQDHANFNLFCEHRDLLRAAVLEHCEEQRKDHTAIVSASTYRYVAYRRYMRFVFDSRRLGRFNRFPIPSCAVKRIRDVFPSNGEYIGFKAM